MIQSRVRPCGSIQPMARLLEARCTSSSKRGAHERSSSLHQRKHRAFIFTLYGFSALTCLHWTDFAVMYQTGSVRAIYRTDHLASTIRRCYIYSTPSGSPGKGKRNVACTQCRVTGSDQMSCVRAVAPPGDPGHRQRQILPRLRCMILSKRLLHCVANETRSLLFVTGRPAGGPPQPWSVTERRVPEHLSYLGDRFVLTLRRLATAEHPLCWSARTCSESRLHISTSCTV